MSGITFERLPPEREAVVSPVAAAGGCCCCCCCCLHTVGGLLGALTAKAPTVDTAGEPPIAVVGTTKVEPRYQITREYWLTLLLICSVGTPLALLLDGVRIEQAEEWFWFFAILLPVFQVVTSAVVGIMMSLNRRPGRKERLEHLGRITLRAFLGALIGVVVMLLLAALL